MKTDREKGPKSEFSRYAFGYSDEKPSLSFWIAPAIMVITLVVAYLW